MRVSARVLALIAALAVGSVEATTYSDRTFLSPRPVGYNRALENATWHITTRDFAHDRYGVSLQAVAFYQESTNRCDLGAYFGFGGTFPMTCGVPATTCGSCDGVATCGGCDSSDGIQRFIGVDPAGSERLKPEDVIHNAPAPADAIIGGDPAEDAAGILNRTAQNTLKGRINFSPRQRIIGGLLSYYQSLDVITHGLYLSMSAPIVDVRTTMGFRTPCGNEGFVSEKLRLPRDTNALLNAGFAYTGPSVTFGDYMTGQVSNPADPVLNNNPNLQDSLKKLKLINGSRSVSGVADINVDLGYRLYECDGSHVAIAALMTIPTGNKPKSEYLFEAVYGNGGHWAFGGALDGAWRVCEHNCGEARLDLLARVDYRYLLRGTETRALLFKNAANQTPAWALYRLGGLKGFQTLFPLANELTRDVNVTPRSMVEVVAMVNGWWDGFCLDMGYDFYYRQRERVRVKQWSNDSVNLANVDFATFVVFDPTNPAHANDGTTNAQARPIQCSDLIVDAAQTPEQATHKIFGGFGYVWHRWTCPLMLGTGGSFEWASDNSALSQWSVWLKAGIHF